MMRLHPNSPLPVAIGSQPGPPGLGFGAAEGSRSETQGAVLLPL